LRSSHGIHEDAAHEGNDSPSTVKRLAAWLAWRNPLLQALVAALLVDLGTNATWGNGTVNGAVFLTIFILILATSILLQRRRARQLLAAQPLPPVSAGVPVDADGTPLALVRAPTEYSSASARDEELWARPAGDGLYRLRSVPLTANGVNRGDLVRCVDRQEELPSLVEVVERSGHRTLRLNLSPGVDSATLVESMPAELSLIRISEEALCVDVHPEDDYELVAAHLDELADLGVLTWCDASELPLTTENLEAS
jgi:Domain of unknown function (DUF4265)